MPIETLDLDGFLQFLKDKQGDQPLRQFAQTLGVSASYLCDVYNQRTVPGDKITTGLASMGASATRSVVYRVETATTDKEKNKP